jgi:hypothetical protein
MSEATSSSSFFFVFTPSFCYFNDSNYLNNTNNGKIEITVPKINKTIVLII